MKLAELTVPESLALLDLKVDAILKTWDHIARLTLGQEIH
jgi:hypothetical protein